MLLGRSKKPSNRERNRIMQWNPPERDWKYVRSVRDDLLAALCGRVNQESINILKKGSASEHDKYLALYRHVQESDRIIADCFNDLKRSNLIFKLAFLQYHGILKAEHVQRLSPETQEKLEALKSLNNR